MRAAWARSTSPRTAGWVGRSPSKWLPAEFASDAERLARFEQEARAAAALNHPNIASVFDVGREPGENGETVHYMVQELLEGQTLGERLAAKGAMPTRSALGLAIEIAEALAAAHGPASSIATSSRPTSSSPRTATRRCSTSGSRS